MMRNVALAVSAFLLGLTLFGAVSRCWPPSLMIFPAILMLGLVFEGYVYKPIGPEPPGPGWDKTPERFADPWSGRDVVVYYNPRTGERRYVTE